MSEHNKILILCKVVDNFGDIGVVYRLARALSDLRPSLELTLVVSNLDSFNKMASQIDPKKRIQDFHYRNSTWKILDWNLEIEDGKWKMENDIIKTEKTSPSTEFSDNQNSKFSIFNFQFSVILECFQCGRPDWLENLLFSDDFTKPVQILNIDYLTAEDYAEDFHLLKSGTRKTNIKKRFFMPGFSEKTGGLIINTIENSGASACAAGSCEVPLSLHTASGTATPPLHPLARSSFNIFFFAYEDDCTALVNGILDFQSKARENDKSFTVKVFVAEGKSSKPFLAAWEKAGKAFLVEELPFMQQEEFDVFITKMDFLFVRGEDSLARAALSGLPYVWQAYKQEQNYQLVKVNALLDRMEAFFPEEEFSKIKKFFQNYNDYENPTESAPLSQMLLSALSKKNTDGFKKMARKLHQNGNLAEHLLTFIDSL